VAEPRWPLDQLVPEYERFFAELPGAVSVGLGQDALGNPVIIVKVDPAAYDPSLIPSTLGGYPVQVEFSMPPRLLHAPHNDRVRPLRPGVSIIPEHLIGGVGTLGGFLLKDGKVYIVSCNHVLAANDPASLGLPVYQPAVGDGPMSQQDQDQVGVVTHYEVMVQGDNRLDIALAEVVLPGLPDLAPQDLTEVPSGLFRVPAPGELLRKSGRTTGLTAGQVVTVNTAVNVDFGPPTGLIRFLGTVNVAGAGFVMGGDSGAWAYDAGMNMVGMVFAGDGSSQAWLLDPLAVESYLATWPLPQVLPGPYTPGPGRLAVLAAAGGLLALSMVGAARAR
jgi:hypothetical protein